MPYMVQDNCVHKKNADGTVGKKMGCHTSKAEAMAQMRALYAAEDDKKEFDSVTKEMTGMGMDEAQIEAMTLKCYGGEWNDNGYIYVPWGIKSFAEWDAWQEAQHVSKEIDDNTTVFTKMVRNIMDQYDVGLNEKMAGIKELADEFAGRTETAMDETAVAQYKEADTDPPEKKESNDDNLVERVFTKIKGLFGLSEGKAESGFMVYKEGDAYQWVARYSNHFRDDDRPKEIIASQSHTRFVEMVEKGDVPPPELWLWHVKEWKIGVADWVAYDPDNGFAVAGGHSLPGTDSVFETMAKTKDIRVSHGMPKTSIKWDESDPTIIIEHVTREISPLPGWAAANKLTGFVVLENETKEADMAIPAEKRKHLMDVWKLPEDILARIEAANATDAEKAKEEGLEHKEKDATDETAPAGEPTSANPSTLGTQPATPVTPDAETQTPAASSELAEIKEIVMALAGEIKAMKEAGAAAQQDALTKALRDTPAASILAMFGKTDSVIGSDATRVDGRTELAKSKPAEPKVVDQGRTYVPFINELLAGKDANGVGQQ